MGLDTMIFIFWMLSFKSAFSISTFTFIKRLFSSSSLSKSGVIWISEVIDISPRNLDSRSRLDLECASSSPAFHIMYSAYRTSLVAQTVKRLSTMWETWVRSLGWEDSLEKEMATHSSTLALKIPWMEELGAGHYPWGRKESGMTKQLHFLSRTQKMQ